MADIPRQTLKVYCHNMYFYKEDGSNHNHKDDPERAGTAMRHRIEALCNTALASAADIILLSEVPKEYLQRVEEALDLQKYYDLAVQYTRRTVGSSFEGYPEGVIRDQPTYMVAAVYNMPANVLNKHHAWALDEVAAMSLFNTVNKAQRFFNIGGEGKFMEDHDFPGMIVQRVVVRNIYTNKKVTVYHGHAPWSKADNKFLQAMAKRMPKEAAILMGDMNTFGDALKPKHKDLVLTDENCHKHGGRRMVAEFCEATGCTADVLTLYPDLPGNRTATFRNMPWDKTVYGEKHGERRIFPLDHAFSTPDLTLEKLTINFTEQQVWIPGKPDAIWRQISDHAEMTYTYSV